MSLSSSRRRPVVAVIDIGSNSGRVVVLEADQARHLRLLTGSRAPLRLVGDVDEHAHLSEETMARTMEAVRDFHAVAKGAGASRVVAVATAAMRDARNGRLFMERLRRELGLQVRILSGRDEARHGFAGAIRGLPVANGLLFDLGGGSLQISQFRARRLQHAVSLPLGALRLSRMFLESDPPRPRELRKLRAHVAKHLSKARLPRLRRSDVVVGTGGTLRNLAKIDRSLHEYPISTLHGYVVPLKRLHRMVQELAATRERNRDEIAGLSAERADSIVGGAVAIETLLEMLGAAEVIVSGQGVREGVAASLLDIGMPPIAQLRESSLASLGARFDGWDASAADRRRSIARQLVEALEPSLPDRIAEAVEHGAWLLDIGRTLDFFDRHLHTADMLLATELDGFSHRDVALVSGIVRLAGDRHADSARLRPLLPPGDLDRLDRAAVLLALADEIERRCPRGRPVAVSCRVGGADVKIRAPALPAWRSRDLGARFQRAFGKTLVVRAK
ncbi:MAG: Ppx/GppA family phosphatase [Acidobacteria bacterium]|nr:Ppx/GppA family phosphatase [Acidobacteriota bacterium]